jgi:hypothetical protein
MESPGVSVFVRFLFIFAQAKRVVGSSERKRKRVPRWPVNREGWGWKGKREEEVDVLTGVGGVGGESVRVRGWGWGGGIAADQAWNWLGYP